MKIWSIIMGATAIAAAFAALALFGGLAFVLVIAGEGAAVLYDALGDELRENENAEADATAPAEQENNHGHYNTTGGKKQ